MNWHEDIENALAPDYFVDWYHDMLIFSGGNQV